MLKEKESLNVEALLAKAAMPSQDALRLHPFYRGKIETSLKCCVRDFHDFAIWYTPGVAAPCKAIEADPEKVYDYTNKWNTVAVISDGTRVLGLGDIGPKAGLPVMEGKALLYKYLGGVDAVPIMLDTKDPDQIINTVLMLQPGFGGVNLEDISQPKCFYILDTAARESRDPGVARRSAGHRHGHPGWPDQRPQSGRQEEKRGAHRLSRFRCRQCGLLAPDL